MTAEPVGHDINSTLMRSTFRIAGRETLGTVFIVGRPAHGQPGKFSFVLATAAHVLNDIHEDEATLFLRTRNGDNFAKLPFALPLRENGRPLWMAHPSADVAAMNVRLPTNADVRMVTTELLASDDVFRRFEIRPGDNVMSLGYPYGAEANDAGFPILRSGRIASFPLVPTTTYPTFLFDFRVFGGNSGGPVYLSETNRTYGGSTRLGEAVRVVLGLVSQEKVVEEEVKSLTETRRTRHQLALAVVVSAPLIRETIDLLPAVTVE